VVGWRGGRDWGWWWGGGGGEGEKGCSILNKRKEGKKTTKTTNSRMLVREINRSDTDECVAESAGITRRDEKRKINA